MLPKAALDCENLPAADTTAVGKACLPQARPACRRHWPACRGGRKSLRTPHQPRYEQLSALSFRAQSRAFCGNGGEACLPTAGICFCFSSMIRADEGRFRTLLREPYFFFFVDDFSAEGFDSLDFSDLSDDFAPPSLELSFDAGELPFPA